MVSHCPCMYYQHYYAQSFPIMARVCDPPEDEHCDSEICMRFTRIKIGTRRYTLNL